jgi:predicted AlkP superfamily phosphohydrolase/phosphomutase
MSTRLLVLGADALDKDLVRGWSDDGTLPAFRRLLRDGARGESEAPPGLFVGAVWPSFWTSTSPARHGRYCFEQMAPGSYETVRVRPTDTREPPFWSALSGAGRRVAVLDVPKTFVAPELNGLQVVDWGTHDPDFEGPITWPEPWRDELIARYGRDEVGNCNRHGQSGEYARLRDQLVARVRARARMIRDVIAREEWDCVIAVFSESHCVGHQCWHLHDPAHADHDAARAREVGDPIRDVYAAIDAAVGEILEGLEPGTTAVVFGSHGMRAHYDATFLLDEMLRRMERPAAAPHAPGTKRRPLAKRIWKRLPPGVRAVLAPLKDPAKAALGLEGVAARRYFALPNNDACGAIRVNLIGREPSGRVRSEDFDAVCAQIERDLLDFVNAETGEPLVRRVLRTAELYRGPALEHLPDLMVEWNRDAPVSRVRSPKAGEIAGRYTKCRTGDHSPSGFFCMIGEDVVRGPVSRGVSIMDFGPTIAERLGVALPGVDGRSFADLVFASGPGSRRAHG